MSVLISLTEQLQNGKEGIAMHQIMSLFSESDVEQILASAQARVAQFHAMGGYLAPGSDAGAYAVFHGAGGLDEFRLLSEALGPAAEAALDRGISAIRQRF